MRTTAILSLLLVIVFPVAELYGAAAEWRTFCFDGVGFTSRRTMPAPCFYVRDGYLPVGGRDSASPRKDLLPAGSGAMAGICYLQTSGGKLQGVTNYLPMAGAVVEISSGERRMAVRSDKDGLFLVALPAGDYEVRVAGFMRWVTVITGKTELVAFRGGKRMVD